MTAKGKAVVYIVSACAILAIVLFIIKYRYKIGQIIVPFFMALIIAYMIQPIVAKLESRNIPRRTGIISLYLVFLVLMVVLIIFVVPEVINNSRELINTLPQIAERYQGMFDGAMSVIKSSKWPPDVKTAVYGEIQGGINAAQAWVMETLKRSILTLIKTVSAMFDLILAMIIAYYFLKDSEFFRELILSLTPRRWRNGILGTGREINLILANFIQGQLLTALIVGILETIGLLIVGAKYPVVLGMIGGIANIIPYFGPILGAIPAVAVALIESPLKAVWTAIVFTIVQQLDNAFISPKIIEGRLGLHPVTTMLAVLVGGEFFGILGMLLAVPVTAILKVILKRVVEAIV